MISERRQHGRFYTPAAVADLTLSLTIADRRPPKRLLDPTCGDGALLAAAVRRGLAETSLIGRDNDPTAISAARARFPSASFEVGDLFGEPGPDLFDAIVGNPPYVRGDRLEPGTRERIESCLQGELAELDWRGLVRRGDLAACALLRSVALLKPNGRLGFVVSAALLEADYGEELWTALSKLGRVCELAAAPRERWFAEAAVNTIIVVFERGANGPTRISRLREATPACVAALAEGRRLDEVADVFVDDSQSPRRWAHLLRAPKLWLELESTSELVPLGEVASIRRGMTTGANSVFYMTRAEAAAHQIEPSTLEPLVRAPARGRPVPITICAEQLDDVVLAAPSDLKGLPGARAYLDANQSVATQPTLSVRDPWWKLPLHRASIFLAKAYARRFVQRFSPSPLVCDQRVYAVTPKHSIEKTLLAAVLNGSLTALAIEALGRASMGEGALEWTVADARSLPVLDPRLFSGRKVRDIISCFEPVRRRSIGAAAAEAQRSDRAELDDALVAGVPQLAQRAAQLAPAVSESAIARETRSGRLLSPR